MKNARLMFTVFASLFIASLILLPYSAQANNAPTLPAVSFMTNDEGTCLSNQDLVVKASGSTDAEGDAVTYTYRWYKDNVLQPDLTNAVVPKDKLHKHEVWKCEVTPTDGVTEGPSVTTEITIANTPPQFATELQTINVVGNHLAQFSMKANDADGDGLTYTDPIAVAGVTIDPQTHMVTIDPAAKTGQVLKFSVTDGEKIVTQAINVVTLPAMTGTDMTYYMPPVGNQGQLGSCATWATGYYYKSFQEAKEKNWSLTDPKHQCSPSFLYNQQVQGYGGTGTYFEDNFYILQTQGCASISAMPYTSNCSIMPNQAQYEEGMPFRSSTYTSLGGMPNITTLRQHLDTGDILVIGVPVYGDSLGATGGNDVHDGPRGTALRGYHALAIVGYDDNRSYTNASGVPTFGAFKFINSWGNTWSGDGYSWMSYNFVSNYNTWAYTMTDRVGYVVKGIADYHITHPTPQNVFEELGIGSKTAPMWKIDPSPFDFREAIRLPDVDVAVDITDQVQAYPPTGTQKWYLGASSAATGRTGSIDTFKIKYRTSEQDAFQEYVSTDVPVVIPDGGTSKVYATINSTITKPLAPSNFVAHSDVYAVTFTWVDNAMNENGFKIEISSDNGATFTELATSTNAPNLTTCTVVGGTPGKQYYYRMRAYNDAGYSAYSNLTTVIFRNAPLAPVNLVAVSVSTKQINLSWRDDELDAWHRCQAEISFDGVNFMDLQYPISDGTIDPPGTYRVMNIDASRILQPNTKYYFRVRSYGTRCGAGYSYSNIASATTKPLPSSPSNLTAQVVSTTQIDLAWQDNSNDETVFAIDQGRSATDTFSEIARVPANTTRYSVTGLRAGGDYYYQIRACRGNEISLPSNMANATTWSIPYVPSNVLATALSGSSIKVTWTDTSNNETGFKIEISKGNNTSFTALATVGANVTSYTCEGLSAGTEYWFRVKAYNQAGESGYSNYGYAKTLSTINAPTSLAASNIGLTQVTLSWLDNSTNETGFTIESSLDGITYLQKASVAANIKTYVCTALSTGTKYYFRVYAYDASGKSGYSNVVQATTLALPVAPSNLVAAALSCMQIKLTWVDNSTDETGFKLERKLTDSGTWTVIASLAANTITYTNSGLSVQTGYVYRIRSYRSSDYSAYSSEAQATTMSLPVAPSNVAATALLASQIKLTWVDNSSDETSFRIERKIGDAGTWTYIAAVAANVTTYTNSSLTAETAYSYRVRALRGSDYSLYSNEAQAVTLPLPAAPSNVAATALLASQIKLTWTDNTSDETGFRIERKIGDAGTWTAVTTVKADVTTYINNGLTAETTYSYRVRSVRSSDYSLYSNEATATTMALPVAPSNMIATALSSTQIKLTWIDNSSDETSFRIERKSGDTGTWTYIAAVAVNVTTYTNASLTAGGVYSYRVRALRVSDYSVYSNEAAVVTMALPAAPSNLTAQALSPSQVKLTWVDNSSDETGFRIERQLGSTGTWTAIASAVANATSYTNSGLVAASTYNYRMRAVRSSDYSVYSITTTVTTPVAVIK